MRLNRLGWEYGCWFSLSADQKDVTVQLEVRDCGKNSDTCENIDNAAVIEARQSSLQTSLGASYELIEEESEGQACFCNSNKCNGAAGWKAKIQTLCSFLMVAAAMMY